MSYDPRALSVMGVQQLISSRLNKRVTAEPLPEEGVEGDFFDLFELKMDDSELLKLKDTWEQNYTSYEGRIKPRQEQNKKYYLGLQNTDIVTFEKSIADNLIFEAEETFLPAALSKNPEPVVFSDNTKEGQDLTRDVKTMLQFHANTQNLRLKLKKMVRHWSIYFMGVLKHGWDTTVNEITTEVIHPQNIILDPKSYIDEHGHSTSYYIGERKTVTADELIKMFGDTHKVFISNEVDQKLGTKVIYTEWNTDKYQFFTYKTVVLAKNKTPHWNYEVEEEMTVSEDGVEEKIKTVVNGKNHFRKSRKPYTFMSVFSLGEQPHDDTSLIEQNIPNQDRINKRLDQIDVNLDHSNNGIALSGDFFTIEQAKEAGKAVQRGSPIWVPTGNIDAAVKRLPAPNLPADAFNQLIHMETQLRSIFGTQGLSSSGNANEKTVRGKIMNQEQDSSRIGGGIGDVIERVADDVFNWWVQLFYVYYDTPHVASILGRQKAVEYTTLRSADMTKRIVVSVSPDSMKPKDELTEMNQAMDLWNAGAIDPVTLFTMLNFPDPKETANNLFLWKTNPQALFQEVQQEQTLPGEMPPGEIPEGVDTEIYGGDGNLSANSTPPDIGSVQI